MLVDVMIEEMRSVISSQVVIKKTDLEVLVFKLQSQQIMEATTS